MSNSNLMRNSMNTATPDDFASKLGELRSLLSDIAKSTPAAASETFDELKIKASALCEACEEKVSDATDVVVKTVKEHPAQVAIAALGVGLLTWWLITRVSTKAE